MRSPKWPGGSLYFQFSGIMMCFLVEAFLPLETYRPGKYKMMRTGRKIFYWWITLTNSGVTSISTPWSLDPWSWIWEKQTIYWALTFKVPWYLYCIMYYVCAQLLSHVWLFASPWTVALKMPLSMGFSWQEYWCWLPFAVSGDLPDPGIKPMSLVSPALADGFFTISATLIGNPIIYTYI